MVNIQVSESTASILSAKASAMGLTVEDFLVAIALGLPESSRLRLTGEVFERLMNAEPGDESLEYSGTFSRADIYREHD
jgi:hypothetical protein